MALTFQLKNRLLQGLNDDPIAYELATKFVDTEEKMTVFERQLAKAEGSDLRSRVQNAVVISQEIWAAVFADGAGA